jgi:hypothetical protein
MFSLPPSPPFCQGFSDMQGLSPRVASENQIMLGQFPIYCFIKGYLYLLSPLILNFLLDAWVSSAMR